MKTTTKKTILKKAAPKTSAKVSVKTKSAPKKVAKAPVKTSAKTPVKTATKTKLVKQAVKTNAKPALKKPAAKKVVKAAVKVAVKKTSKPATKAVQKTTAKTSAKVVNKKSSEKKLPVKPVSKVPQKSSKSSKSVTQSTVKAKSSSDSKSATVKVKKVSEAAKKESPKAFDKTTKVEKLNTVTPQVIAPVSPAVTKAKSSRLASLTVPSMAQSVASTAAKASFGPVVNAPIVFAPAPFVVKQNPKLANNWKTKSAEELNSEEVLSMPASEYMNIKQMMFFRLRLIELKQGILESAGATSEHLRDESAVVPDPTDRATIEEEHALELRTRDRERKLLKKIEQSIARIDAGDYGYCDETGEAIGVGRLLARPTATLSLEAQQRRELKQKMYGD